MNNIGTGAPAELYRVAASFRDPSPHWHEGLVLYKREELAARQREHYQRVCRLAREMLPDVAGTILKEEDLVNLMYGDADDYAAIVMQEGAYDIYVCRPT